jgi:transglutaminase-like putative cysteine protease
VSVNLFTSLQQDIVNQSSEPVFLARVSQAAPPNRDLYWKLITLDVFDGDHWLPGSLAIGSPGPNDPWEADDFSFQGPTIRVEQVIAIGSLRQNYLPILHSPVALSSEVSLLEDSYRVREDGSVKFDARTFQGLTYRVTSDIPVPDLAALASRGGKLSPIFQSAVDSGAINLVASKQGGGTAPSRVIALYLDLPDSLPPDIGDLAQEVAKNGSTGFERAILLEAFFRASGRFVYDARASTGHSSLDLSEWLNNPESRNYRTGYCEQFATAMAVMARTLGIPSRLVIGFAPGELSNQADGSELIIVRQRNTHAWVEVWIGGQGWVRLDPTPRADGINRSTTASLGFDPTLFVPAPGQLGAAAGAGSGGGPDAFDRFLEEGADPTAGLPGPSPNALPGWLRTAAAGIAVMGLVPVLKKIRRQLRLRRLRRGDIAAAWIEITDQLRDLGHPVEDYLTPLEIAGDLDPMLFPLAQRVTTAVYGERAVTGAEEAFRSAERHLRNRHPSRERILGRLALRSLRPRS